jgi:flagellar motility protein MotE (MotC chaperone)
MTSRAVAFIIAGTAAGLLLVGGPASADKVAVQSASATRLGTAIEDDLAQQRARVEARARALDLREKLLAATEKRLADRGTELRQVQTTVTADAVQANIRQDTRLVGLAKVYSTMKPRDAARVFERLDPALQIAIGQRMKDRAVASLLAQMNPDIAMRLTTGLANAKPLPPVQPAAR